MTLEPTGDIAELVGVLLGDGSIARYHSMEYSTFYGVKVTLCSDEIAYIDHVKRLMTRTLKSKPKERKQNGRRAVDLRICKKGTVNALLELGMALSPKWERARIPEIFMIPELGYLVLRGYFDTDGCVAIVNNNGTTYPRLEMKISPGPFQAQLIALLRQYGMKHSVHQIGKGKVRVQMNGRNAVQEWVEKIGFHNEKHTVRAEQFLTHNL